jgi:hypothetical protein
MATDGYRRAGLRLTGYSWTRETKRERTSTNRERAHNYKMSNIPRARHPSATNIRPTMKVTMIINYR